MCAASSGSHFASGNGKSKGKMNDMVGFGNGNYSAEDTFSGISSTGGFGDYAPNGSNSSQMEPVQTRGVVSETDEFLAVSMGEATGNQPQLEVAESPVDGPVNPLLAAQMASRPAATQTEGNLFPISEVETKQGVKNFDTTFNEGGSKKSVVVIVLVILLVIAAFAGGFFLLNNREAQTAREKLASAVENLYATDAVFTSLDETIASGSIDVSLALEQSTTTMNSLSAAEKDASEADRSRGSLTAEEQSALDSVLASVSARRSMLEAARMIQNVEPTAVSGFEGLQQAYAYLGEANNYYQAAVAMWSSMEAGGEGTYGEMLSYLATANENLAAARTTVESTQAAGTDVDFTALSEYITTFGDVVYGWNGRVENGSNGDWENAAAFQEVAERNAALMATQLETLSASAEEYAVAHHSSAAVQTYVSNYGYAREKGVTADAVVSGYLGSKVGLSATLPAAQAPAAQPAAEEAPAEGEEQVGEEAAESEQPVEAEATAEQAEA